MVSVLLKMISTHPPKKYDDDDGGGGDGRLKVFKFIYNNSAAHIFFYGPSSNKFEFDFFSSIIGVIDK